MFAVLLLILAPFYFYDRQITGWTEAFIQSPGSAWLTGGVLAALLAFDIVLPVPSSIVGAASGYLLGFQIGALVCWLGMTAGCWLGYWIGSRAGRPVTRKLVGDEELERVSRAQDRFGGWVIIVFRAVPVLAEASVLFAGVAGMPLRRFLTLTSLSNLGIAIIYAFVGAYSVQVESFLLAFVGALAIPGIAMLLARRSRL